MPEVNELAASVSNRRGESLRTDCAHCFGLCCVAPAFSASADFAIAKKAGQPCPNLTENFRCSIHDRLRKRGFSGCAAYDCFGAGQKVVQLTFEGQDWRRTPGVAQQMFKVFTIMRQLHELMWYLSQALALPLARPLYCDLSRAFDRTQDLTYRSPDGLAGVDVAAHRADISVLLLRASEMVRVGVMRKETDFSGADLVGKDLAGADLRGASMRGARLIGADLRGSDMRLADVIGADLRGADLRRADFTTAIFATQSQLDAANGDVGTKIPPSLTRPEHWRAGPA